MFSGLFIKLGEKNQEANTSSLAGFPKGFNLVLRSLPVAELGGQHESKKKHMLMDKPICSFVYVL